MLLLLSKDAADSGSGTPQPLRAVAVENRVPTSWVNYGSTNRHASTQKRTIAKPCKSLAVFQSSGLYKNFTINFYDYPNAFTIQKSWIVCPNNAVVLLKWGGARTKTITPGDPLAESDEISYEEAGYASEFPAGDYYIHSELSFSGGGSIPYTEHYKNVRGYWYDSASTTLSNADAASASLTFSGTAPSEPYPAAFDLVLIGRHSTAQRVPLVIGDSITNGVGDDANAAACAWGMGYWQRAMSNAGSNMIPNINLAASGTRLWTFAQGNSITRWDTWFDYLNYVTDIYFALGTNDLSNYAHEYTTNHFDAVNGFAADSENIQTINWIPPIARTNAANTAAEDVHWGAPPSRRKDFLDLIDAEVGADIDSRVDLSTMRNGASPWLWATTSDQSDGVHTTPQGAGVQAALVRAHHIANIGI